MLSKTGGSWTSSPKKTTIWKPLKLLSEIPVLYLLRISIHTSVVEPISDLTSRGRTLK